MAFPTSPSNNQVHKEGNKSFVYDSTAGVWDQVPERPRTGIDSDVKERYGSAGNHATFSGGSVIQVLYDESVIPDGTGTTAQVTAPATSGNMTNYIDVVPKALNSTFLIMCHSMVNGTFGVNQCAQDAIWRGVGATSTYFQPGSQTAIYANSLVDYSGAANLGDHYFQWTVGPIIDKPSYTAGQIVTYVYVVGSGRGSGSVSFPNIYTRRSSSYPGPRMTIMEIAA